MRGLLAGWAAALCAARAAATSAGYRGCVGAAGNPALTLPLANVTLQSAGGPHCTPATQLTGADGCFAVTCATEAHAWVTVAVW